MKETSEFITSVGFPIAVASGLAVIMYKVFILVFSKFIDTLDELTETNRILAEGVNKRVDRIETKVDVVIEKLK